jgi:anaerobic selenocysteine-containing dehydrogenase
MKSMKKIERRDFLKIAGGVVVGGATGFVFSGAPFYSLQWLVEWSQDQYVPGQGEERFIKGICQYCPNRCDITVRMIGDRAVKVETSNGGCPMGQALLQLLYHPERVKYPLKRVGKKGSGKYMPVSWEEALKDISSKLNELRKAGRASSIAAINHAHTTVSNLLLERLVMASGSPHVYHESCTCNHSRAAVQLTLNDEGTIWYDLENSDFILSFSARLLEGWGHESNISKAFSNWRNRGAKLVQIDTLCSRTASMADEWIPINPGTESVLALGIAYQLLRKGKRSSGANFSSWSQIIFNLYPPEKVSKITGVPVETIGRLASEFARSKRPVAISGRGGKSVSSSVAEIVAIQCLNNLVGNFGENGGIYLKQAATLGEPDYDSIASESMKKAKRSRGLDDFILNGDDFDLLFINESNPVYKSTLGERLAEKMSKASMVVSFMTLINDTASYSDYILPTLSSLERPSSGDAKAIAPRYQSIHAGDIILKISKGIDGVSQSFPWSSYKSLLDAAGKDVITKPKEFIFQADIFKNHLKDITTKLNDSLSEYPLVLIPFEIPTVGDGEGLALPYVLKSIDGKIFSQNKMWVHMNPETAEKNGLSEGSSADLISKRGEIGSVKIHLTKTVAPDVVAAPLGFGHSEYTKYASGKGFNPKQIMSDEIDPVSGNADWWFTRIKIS